MDELIKEGYLLCSQFYGLYILQSRSSTNPEKPQPVAITTTSTTVTQVSVTTTCTAAMDPEIIKAIEDEGVYFITIFCSSCGRLICY